jgi:hypothetical protein
MELVFRNGRRTRVPSIDRGRLLVYSEDEWRRRFKNNIIISIGVLFALFFTSSVFPDIFLEVEWTPILILTVFLIAFGLFIGIAGYSMAILSLKSSWALPGVYERGVQLSFSTAYPTFRRVFLPYSEIERAIWQGSKGERTIALFLHRSNRTISLNEHYFGLDGVRVVKAVVGGWVTIPKVAGGRG